MNEPEYSEFRDAFLIDFGPSTARGYRADLEHFAAAQEEAGSSVLGSTSAELFRYLRSMQLSGYSSGTLRRRMACLRSFYRFLADRQLNVGVDFEAVARRLSLAETVTADIGSSSAVFASDDAVVRAGLHTCMRAAGIVDSHASSLTMPDREARTPAGYDYVVAHVFPGSDPDRLKAIGSLHLMMTDPRTTTVVVAAVNLTALQQLRLAEAGCNFVYPYRVVADEPDSFAAALRTAQMNERYRLPTQWALRQALDLRWDGAIGPFLEAASEVPTEVWTTYRPQSALPIGRPQVRELQRLARDRAGLPEADFRRYATSTRRPPQLPEWRLVQNFVRELWGHPVQPRAAVFQ